jgi:hypothetical protein
MLSAVGREADGMRFAHSSERYPRKSPSIFTVKEICTLMTAKVNLPAGRSPGVGRLFPLHIARREKIMTRIDHILLVVMLAATLISAGVGSAGVPRKPAARQPAGAVTFSGTIAAPPDAAGVTWGKGTLILSNDTQHAFEVTGLGVKSTREAIVTVHAVGEVFNLKKLSDFEGTYKITQSEYTVGRSSDEVSLANERGVVMVLAVKSPATTQDVTLTPSPTGLTVNLKQ